MDHMEQASDKLALSPGPSTKETFSSVFGNDVLYGAISCVINMYTPIAPVRGQLCKRPGQGFY